MISNLDWAMQAGPAGDTCCHNSRLISAGGTPPYYHRPLRLRLCRLGRCALCGAARRHQRSSVKSRCYRGFCRHNAEALKAAADIRSQQAALLAVLRQIPQLREGTRRKAAAYLERSFADIATDQAVTTILLKTCVG